MILETVPVSLRGALTRWMVEPHTGVFVGCLSAMVRDRLWLKCCQGIKSGGVLMINSTNNEQGFQMQWYGHTRRHVVDYDGLQLIREESQAIDVIKKSNRSKRNKKPVCFF